ncbi:hypothetical protein [Roseobacter sp. A03A-229]
MDLPESIQIAESTMIDAEAHGFDATAKAMRNLLNEMLTVQRGIETTLDRSSEPLQGLVAWN